MLAKHSVRLFGPARLVFAISVAVLVGLVVWAAVRAVGPDSPDSRRPTVVLPSTPQIPVGEVDSPSPSPRPSAHRTTSSPRPTAHVRSKTASRSPSRSPTPSHTRTVAPSLTATVTVTAGWGGGYVAAVRVLNTGTKAATWSVKVTHRGLDGIRLNGTWNATGSQQGDTFIFTGGPLAPGATANFGYQMTERNGRGRARPAGCTVVGGRCSVS